MPVTRPRTARIEARIAPEALAVVKRAAEIQGRSVSDFVVAADSARYAFADAAAGLYPSAAEDLLAERYGRPFATELLYLSAGGSGAQLQARGWTCPLLPRERVATHAFVLAASLARKSQTALRLLKQHLARPLAAAVRALMQAMLSCVISSSARRKNIRIFRSAFTLTMATSLPPASRPSPTVSPPS